MKNPYKRIIIWGLREKYHTHRYIHHSFYTTAKKLGWDALWVEDDPKNADCVQEGDLVIASQVSGKMVKEKKVLADYHLPIKKGVFYCLHNYSDIFTDQLDRTQFIMLQVYSNDSRTADQQWDEVRWFDTRIQTLYQPWGTNLLPEEFKKPIASRFPIVFWIGSIWNNIQNQGNIPQINELKAALKKHGVRFLKLQFIPEWLNTFFIRHSRLAPAIAGTYQVNTNYLPCRMFKNISYGQLGFSNVKKFDDILKGCALPGNSISELVENAYKLKPSEYKELISRQQDIMKEYTYVQSYETIFRALQSLR